jgi:acyl carrier protein
MKTGDHPAVVSTRQELSAAVIRSLRRANSRIQEVDIDEDSSIIDDLGFDSLKMVELLFALEDELEVADFPLQSWWDSEVVRADGARFTVGSLLFHVIVRMAGESRNGDEE